MTMWAFFFAHDHGDAEARSPGFRPWVLVLVLRVVLGLGTVLGAGQMPKHTR